MNYRLLQKDELKFLTEIDRKEIIEEVYYFKNHKLELVKEFYDIQGWDLEELNSFINRLDEIYDRKGTIYGAFDKGKIVGLAALESGFMGENKDKIKLDMLYISTSYRKKGIGKKLMCLSMGKARVLGAKILYISATPTRKTVEFYLAMGARVTDEIDKELYELEPYDIHMELNLCGSLQNFI
ncbi:MAG: GNAT family N-acetyltransferase [Clostridium sp.]|uniref:GNAT family N-acetyltransferase n=1 Tax=Clostridium sp. TaxID=1506 RepID=UPI003D6DA299